MHLGGLHGLGVQPFPCFLRPRRRGPPAPEPKGELADLTISLANLRRFGGETAGISGTSIPNRVVSPAACGLHKDLFSVQQLHEARAYFGSTEISTLAPCVIVLSTGENSMSLSRRSMFSTSAFTLSRMRMLV